ncbi:MAG: TIGR02710 family CRISPR-associated CARF protein [candidate division WOR-3 bacterium]
MNRMFVATVGKGDLGDIREALVKSIHEANPSLLLLFATEQTRENAQDICKMLNRDEKNSEVHILRSPGEDIEALFKEMADKLAGAMREYGISPSEVTADFTSGLKTMSAALVMAAVKLGLGRLKYINAKRDATGRICPGQERTVTLEPAGLKASFALDSAVSLMRQYRFDAVRQLLEPLRETLLNATEQANRACLLHLADAYSRWDLFQHIQFKDAYDKASFAHTTGLEEFRATPATVSAVMEVGQKSKDGKTCDLVAVDLINNARRRMEEGRFDDSVARLYRACELLAQVRLASRQINTDDVDVSKLPEKTRRCLELYRNKEGKIQIGLRNSYKLLKELNDELGMDFDTDKELKSILKTRNYSILAHGTIPVSQKTAQGLLVRIEALAKRYIPDYDSKSDLLRFPWSR